MSTKILVGGFAVIVAVVLVVLFVIVLLWMTSSDDNQAFVSGYIGKKYQSKSGVYSINELHNGTRDMLAKIANRNHYPVDNVYKYYTGFLDARTKMSPKLKARVQEIVDHIYYETGFSSTRTGSYVALKDMMIRLKSALLFYLESAKTFAECSGDSHAEKIASEYTAVSKVDPDEHRVRNILQLQGDHADKVLTQMKEERLERQKPKVPKHLYLESIKPRGPEYMSAYEVGVQNRTIEPFDGNIHDYNHRKNTQRDSIQNADDQPEEACNGLGPNLNYPTLEGERPICRNHVTLTNYRGRNFSLGTKSSGKSKK